jgi:hypothetical protein
MAVKHWNLYSWEFCAAFGSEKIGIYKSRFKFEGSKGRIFRIYKLPEFGKMGISFRVCNVHGKISN